MTELFLRTLLIGLATSVGSYFIIKFLHKHLRQVTIFLGVAVFAGLFGYGIYKENKTQHELDDAISNISKAWTLFLRSILPFLKLTRFIRPYCRIQIIRS